MTLSFDVEVGDADQAGENVDTEILRLGTSSNLASIHLDLDTELNWLIYPLSL